MKTSAFFKQAIQAYLDQCILFDELFREKYNNPKKNIDDCITYILNTVQRSGINGFHDNEIFGMAVHYYDEDNIEVGNPINSRVVINRLVELTEEEKAQIRKDAIEKVHNEAYNKAKQPVKRIALKTKTPSNNQPTLF